MFIIITWWKEGVFLKNKIIIVEDEEAIAKMISMNLRVAGYDTEIFFDGGDAAKSLLDNHDFDLAILDIMLPSMDGLELQKHMKKYDIPVIFLTARDDIESKVSGLRGGAEDYMIKPFEILELLVRVEKILERNKKKDECIHIGKVEVHPVKRLVIKDGQEVNLKPMEFDLLMVLIKYKNIAISREKLLSLVWGCDYYGETRTVDVHVGQLRKKLGLTEEIKTVSKVGYRLEI